MSMKRSRYEAVCCNVHGAQQQARSADAASAPLYVVPRNDAEKLSRLE
jgi:hypothetical protein